MADTIQLVTWSLEQKCLLRPGKKDASPQLLEGVLARAKGYSAGLRDNKQGFGVFGDIYVSSYTSGTKPSGDIPTPSLSYPAQGFVVSDEFRDFGGPEGLFRMCGNCPANATPHDLVGCAGSLYQSPNSIETEDQLRRIVTRLGIEAEVHAAFPQTTPMWYGLWAVSPVPKRSLTVLRTLMSEMLAEDRGDTSGNVGERQLRDFALFIKAIDLALERNLRLQVALLPLGHTDFGVYTIFPHCPFCKAVADTKRWQLRYPAALQSCRVCGTEFSPTETASARRMKWERPDLREVLGREKFKEFACEYLMAFGNTREAAGAIVVATEAAEDERNAKWRQTQELNTRKRAFLQARIFAGLETVAAPPSEKFDEEDEDEQADAVPAIPWFDKVNFEEVLRRSVATGLTITFIRHVSPDRERDKHWYPVRDPLGVLKGWLEQGYSGKFYAHIIVPDSLVKDEGAG